MDRKIDIAAGYIEDLYSDWSAARTTKANKWRQYYRVWRLIEDEVDKKTTHEKSKIKIPATKQAVATAVDNIFHMSVGPDQFFDIRGRQVEDDIKAALVKSYIDYLFYREGFKGKFAEFITELCIYGTAIGMIKLNTVMDKRIKNIPNYLYDMKVSSENIVEKKEISRPEFEHISIYDFYIDPSAKTINEAEGVIVRSNKRLKELYTYQRSGIISGVELIKDKPEVELDDHYSYRLNKSGITASKFKGVTVKQFWGWLDEDILKECGFEGQIEDGGAEVLCITANGDTVLKLVNNPLLTEERPFVKDCFEEVPGEFYGIGICEATEGAQAGLDATVRQRIDNKALAINQIYSINVQKLVPGQDLDIYPGKKFLTNGDDAIKPIVFPDVTNGSYHEAQEFERYIQKSAGISEMFGGIPTSKEQSATESRLLINQSSLRAKTIVISLEYNVIRNILRFYYMMIQQFLNVPEIIKVQTTGGGAESLLEITADQIAGDYDFIPMGTSTLAAKDSVTKLIELLTRTANPYDVQVVNRPYLIRKIYEMLGFNDADRAIVNVPPQQMLQNAQMGKNVGSAPRMPQEMPNESGRL